MSKPVHAFFATTSERMRKQSSSKTATDAKANGVESVVTIVDDDNGGDDDDFADTSASASAASAKRAPKKKLAAAAAVPAKTRRKLVASGERNKADGGGSGAGGGGGVLPNDFFFKTPSERAALKQAERLQRLDADRERSRSTTQAILGDRPLHPLFETVAQRSKALLASSSSLSLDPAAAAGQPSDSSTPLMSAPWRLPDNHVDQLAADELAPVGESPLARWALRGDADGLMDGVAHHVWPPSMRVTQREAAGPPPERGAVRFSPPQCEAERLSQLDADLMQCLQRLPSPFVTAESGAPVEHPAYRALQRWQDDPSAPIPSLRELESLFELNAERPPLAKWLRRTLELASQANPGAATSLWTDKYRPLQGTEMAGNVDNARMLSQWLAAWKSDQVLNDASFPDAMLDDDERLYPAVLLVGPTGSLKTAAAYACAARHQYNVLEVNAGSVRTGRLIMQMFGEATQSHHLSAARLGAAAFEQHSSSGGGGGGSGVVVDSDGHSMVLFEEIDVLCDDDRGFFAALKQLMVQTKRPIVLTCNELTDEIHDLLNQQPARVRAMQFARPELTHTIARCAFVAFAERRAVSVKALGQLALAHDCDLRRMLCDLQFGLSTASRVTRGVLDGVFGLAHLNERHGGLDVGVRNLATTPLSALDALALDMLPLDATHRIAAEYAKDASADVLDALALATEHLSLCAQAELRTRELCTLYDAVDTHLPDAFNTRAARRLHANADEDDRWLATPLGASACVVAVSTRSGADDGAPPSDELAPVAASADELRAPFSRPVCDQAPPGGLLLTHVHRWATLAAIECVRRTRGVGDDRVASLSPLRSEQMPLSRANRGVREELEDVAAILSRRLASDDARTMNLHFAALISRNDELHRASQEKKRRPTPHHMASYLEAEEIRALSRVK
jgi:hypothetical protein